MHLLPYLAAYVGVGVFLLAVVVRFAMWSRMPMHVRWELYPVAHEGERARWGGSFMEEGEWWTKPRHVDKLSEAKAMFSEIVFLVAVKEHNPKLWTRTFPFHFGLYLVIATVVLLVMNGILAAAWPDVVQGAAGEVLRYAIMLFGYAGTVLCIIGALGLFARRRGRELRDYTAPADYFNLLFFVVVFGVAGVAFILDPTFGVVSAFVANLVTFSFAPIGPGGPATTMALVSALLLGLLVAYIPLTHMSHFIGKYFAYHAIRWNDKPNLKGGDEEDTINNLLKQPITWAGPHIKGDGKKTWLDAATEELNK